MPDTILAPLDLLKEVASFRLPSSTQQRLDWLLARNAEGTISPVEKEELEALVELNERIAILKGRAMLVLDRPGA